MRPDPHLVAIDILSRRRRNIGQNSIWTFAYNVIGIPLAPGCMLDPVCAAAEGACSIVSIVANTQLVLHRQRSLLV